MATRETRQQRGHRRGDEALRRLVSELRDERRVAGLSQAELAAELHWSQTEISRLERNLYPAIALVRLAEIAAALGLELSAGLHRNGDGLRDRGQQAVASRLLAIVAPVIKRWREVPLPNHGDRRSWDVLLRLGSTLIGVEIETRIRDMQALVRKIRERERDGGVDHVLLVLADSAHNRALVDELREALGPRFSTSPRLLLRALRTGTEIPGSGVILV